MPFNQIQRSGVTTCDSFPRQILKVCVLGRVEAWYWKPNIVFRQTTNISPVRTCLIITCKSRICKFWIEYYSSRVTTPNSTWYSTPNITRIPSFFGIVKRGWVICQNLHSTIQNRNAFDVGAPLLYTLKVCFVFRHCFVSCHDWCGWAQHRLDRASGLQPGPEKNCHQGCGSCRIQCCSGKLNPFC